MERVIHTPEGVRDIYGGECARKRVLLKKLHKVFVSYGYEDIETPTFEYFDVFSREIGTIPSKDLYKFFDREGDTLVLRPDFTPSVARAASRHFIEEGQRQTVRLCYQGNTFLNSSSYQGRPREVTEMGVGMMGGGEACRRCAGGNFSERRDRFDARDGDRTGVQRVPGQDRKSVV